VFELFKKTLDLIRDCPVKLIAIARNRIVKI